MKLQAKLIILAILAMLVTAAGWAQNTQVSGTATDHNGKPLVGASVDLTNVTTGQKFSLKTDKNGQYGGNVPAGTYNIRLTHQGLVLSGGDNISISAQIPGNVFNFDLSKTAESGAKASAEEKAKREAVARENAKIAGLNQMLTQANAAQQAGNYEQAVQILTQATQSDPTRDLLWARLGDAHLNAGRHAPASDRAKAAQEYTQAVAAFKKALELKPNDAAYHEHLGEAYARTGQTQQAVQEYRAAAQNDPTNAARYYFNEGAVLTNAGKTDDANGAFDKAIAADPKYAEAYYQKAVNLMAKATVDNQGKYKASPEVAADLNKYLQLAPDGPNAPTAKQLLDALGEKVETTFSKGKGAKK